MGPSLLWLAPSGRTHRLAICWSLALGLIGCGPGKVRGLPLLPDAAAPVADAATPSHDAAPAPRDASPVVPDAPASTDSRPPDEPAVTCGPCPADQICLQGKCQGRGELVTPPSAACASPPCINVVNDCPVPLWIHALATVPIDGGTVRRLGPGEQWQYAGLPLLGGGRLYAYYKEPDSKQETTHPVSDFNQFVEMTIDRDAFTGALAQNYNISYVDYLALPVLMKAGGACADTRCGARFQDWMAMLATCPTELRNQYQGLGTCAGSYNYCITPEGPATYDTTRPYCTKMRDAHGFPGSAIYGGSFADRPAQDVAFWDGVAAWNRGAAAGDADDGHYYQHQPYNDYAAWIHQSLGCKRVYAFSTDDHQDQAGFVRCAAPTLDVVWCPYR
jgi:hypothetical protein